MTTRYSLWYEHEIEDGEDEFTLIGIYSSEGKALAVIPSVKEHPDFKGQPGEFRVCLDELDETGWDEGFITRAEAMLPKE
jgi:hypothetical protein